MFKFLFIHICMIFIYNPSTRSFFETDNAKFIKDVELSGRESLRNVVFQEESVSIPIITTGHGHIMFDDYPECTTNNIN